MIRLMVLMSMLLVVWSSAPLAGRAEDDCRFVLKLEDGENPAFERLRLKNADPKIKPLTLERNRAGNYELKHVSPGKWTLEAVPIKAAKDATSWPSASHQVIHLSRPGEYVIVGVLGPDPKRVGLRRFYLTLEAAPKGAEVFATKASQRVGTAPGGAEIPPKPAAPTADDVPLPKTTPFDSDKNAQAKYLLGYREGYLWATLPERRAHCLTNPSDSNRPAIHGIIEGWRAGVPHARGVPGDLPAKYAPFIEVVAPARKGE